MHFRFNFEKSLQATGVLLGLDGDRMEYMRLLKLLYIADREMLAETGAPITGDRAVAMKHGPVLSQVYDLIKGQSARAGEWDHYVRSINHNVELRNVIDRGKLNKAEVEKLQRVTERYRDDNVWDICEKTHEFPEWERNYVASTSTTIPWEHVLEAQGKAHIVEAAEKEEELQRYLDSVFGA
jgi:uncharacterized phage-associated protein